MIRTSSILPKGFFTEESTRRTPKEQGWAYWKPFSNPWWDILILESFDVIFLLCAYLKGVKESACWEATQFVFPYVLSALDDCYYCSNTIVSLLFKLCAMFSLWLQERSKVGACCPETDSVCLTKKLFLNHQIIFLIWIFWQYAPYNYLSGVCSEIFDLCCRSASKRILFSLLFCFSQLLSLFFFSQFCKP